MSTSIPSFEDDLRLIREERNISRETLHEQTKVPLENIELFEAGELRRHPHFNDVYLRALVRAYADVLGISKEVVLQAFERSRAGGYQAELGRTYLDRAAEAGDSESREEEDTGGSAAAPGGDQAPIEDRIDEPAIGSISSEEDVETGSAEGPAGDPDSMISSEQSSLSTTHGSEVRSAGGSAASGGTWSLMGARGKVVMGVAGLVLLLLAIWALASVTSTAPPPDDRAGTAAVDTMDTSTAGQAAAPSPVAIIGDSLDFTVVAARARLEPVRIRIDDGPWNPYWIEQGDSMSFAAQDEFSLRSYLPRVRLRVESLVWPVRASGRYDTLTVSRRLVEERIDSLSALRGPR